MIRYFLHKPEDYQDFFYSNRERYNQDAIIYMTERIADSSLKSHSEAAAQFGYDDWRYYMARYAGANRQYNGYGYYAWRHYDSAPLEVFILNSSLFGEDNLAWSMMLNIIDNCISDEWPHTWDTHQQPIEFTQHLFTLNFKQRGWILRPLSSEAETNIDNAISALGLDAATEDDGSRCIAHRSGCDYIESCMKLLRRISEASEKEDVD